MVSPHLDDAVLSLGALLADAARRGAEVTVLTVLAGDPASTRPAGDWDAACGFRSAGEAARTRREEDRRACALIGARPAWLPFGDEQYGVGADDATVHAAIAEAVEGADVLLAPGRPLWHRDHRWLARLVVDRDLPVARVGLYEEQPYALWDLEPRPDGGALPDALLVPRPWSRFAVGPVARLAKARACRAYRTQLPSFGKRPVLSIQLHDLRAGGEGVAWL